MPLVSRRLDYASREAQPLREDGRGHRGGGRFIRPEQAPRERRARGRWAEPCPPGRGCSTSCRKENGRARQPQPGLQLKLQPFPSRAFVPAVSGYPLGQQAPQEAGRPRWEGSGFQAHLPV